MDSLSSFVEPWKQSVHKASSEQPKEFPDYYQPRNAECLIATSQPRSFQLGTGASIYTNSLLPAIFEAQHEVTLVTCFWAFSSTLTALRDTLEQLAEQRKQLIQTAAAGGPDADDVPPLRIRICFSSRSLWQKLFHTSSKDGYVYPPSTWPTQLGLPSRGILEAGAIELQVKSLFFLPFSVMHPKFLIVDRKRAWLPSCNVSWEPWLEGCVEVTGDVVPGLVRFYQSVWDRKLGEPDWDARSNYDLTGGLDTHSSMLSPLGLARIQSPASRFATTPGTAVPTLLLPSSHHRNPRFRPFPWPSSPTPPSTPLNIAMLRLFEMAQHTICIQTPNLTTAAVLDSILDAVKRGVDVTVVTSKGMMLLEQLVTAGTTTSICLRSLIRRYKKLMHAQGDRAVQRESSDARESDPVIDLEAHQRPNFGRLKVSYFHADTDNRRHDISEEPVHSHLKLTIVDGQFTVLGSGNMDRPSWFTSQELGIMFHSADFAKVVSDNVAEVLKGRLTTVFDSAQE
ncbi:uncharacterized protein BCR38DRAFT_453641 [Pseudomassariella vexata]|uniref:PLD phosphodiesterase domain-containing protein n=1 Tax=Pseudomassariella vexata TaxID=1141098 RepID=A0A1Y2EHD8_9PEZI|nr:uncharacterized protein BCR38DRAFT_453641 [Pseudomassariella vexata]ORY70973.1 hypothetical protein BCR38DRAFT_453641 [Pseudomassariella vexata]